MRTIRILWVDDEIDLLQPHVLFLQTKGYEVQTATNGDDAIELVNTEVFDLVFLDEHMPGLSGLQTLNQIKSKFPGLPVVMITKSEEEDIMDIAIGSKISDYLIKPVNPNQILLSIKKNIDTRRLVSREVTSAYQVEFNKLGTRIGMARTYEDWKEIYKALVFWEMELESLDDKSMQDILVMQKQEANRGFGKFIKDHYLTWFDAKTTTKPLLSPNVFREKVFPLIDQGEKVFVLVIDNLRLDHWKKIASSLLDNFIVEYDDVYCSILPTATQYARNAMFAGLMPFDIQKMHPNFWVDEDEEMRKNDFEGALLEQQINRLGKKIKFNFEKVLNTRTGKRIVENFDDIKGNDLNVVVYNFVDMLSHARTEMDMIKELASNESAFRSLAHSWFNHSNLIDLLQLLAETNIKVVITTDHGSIRVQNPIKVVGDKDSSVNIRYKQGRNLDYRRNEVFEITDPGKAHLPKLNISTSYIFATESNYMVYPKNFNHFVNFYKNTFQHGGISMEEMLIPLVILRAK